MVFGLKLGLLSNKAQAAPPPNDGPAPAAAKGGSSRASKSALTVNEFVARTKRCREKGLEPTKPELVAYARYLGIDPVIDADLMWIVDESLNAPLPSEWTEHHDSAGRVFYYNVHNHSSSWTHPLEQLHRDTYKEIVNFRSGNMTKEEQIAELDKLRRQCEEAEREAHRELQAWTEHVDEQGQKFYNSREQQRSYWTDPRPARCHALYLQMKALRVLAKHCGQTSRGAAAGALLDPSRPLGLPLGDGTQSSTLQQSPNGGAEGLQSGDEGGQNPERRKRKNKRRDNEAHRDDLEKNVISSPQEKHVEEKDGPDPWDLKRPSRNAVDEVRKAIGVAGGSLPGHTGPLPSLPAHGRLPTPPGDGLSTVGRSRVRAGIRLEPLKGAA
mmetsp:Transcript_97842/g.276948  ORF Transcript_97842/g.276948 Transcript_97842/m.276948 type:complete len:384 (+) Transcript_97842:126-1277(+)